MDRLEERKFQLHSQTEEYQQRIERAEKWIHRIFDQYDNPYLSVSGGKDSLVMHHIAAQRCGFTDIDVFHFDWGARNIPGVEDFVRKTVESFGGNLIARTSEGVQDEAFAKDEHNGMQGIIGWTRTLSDEHGWDAALLGIRAEESSKRRYQYNGEPPSTDGPVTIQFAPVHRLTTQDIWAYIVSNNLPYHEIYEKQAELYGGIDSRSNRLVTVYDHEFSSLGSEAISQFIYPEKTNELKNIEQKRGRYH